MAPYFSNLIRSYIIKDWSALRGRLARFNYYKRLDNDSGRSVFLYHPLHFVSDLPFPFLRKIKKRILLRPCTLPRQYTGNRCVAADFIAGRQFSGEITFRHIDMNRILLAGNRGVIPNPVTKVPVPPGGAAE